MKKDFFSKVFDQEIQNILKRLASGKTISSDQRKILKQYSDEQSRNVELEENKSKAIEGHAKSITSLAEKLNVARKTIYAHIKSDDHPKQVDGLGWNVYECRLWYTAKGAMRKNKENFDLQGSMNEKTLAEARKEKARARILELKAGKDEGLLIEVSVMNDEALKLYAELANRMRTIPSTIGMLAAGKSASEIEAIAQKEYADAFEVLHKLPWLTPEDKKKMAQVNSSCFTQASQQT